LWSDKENSEGEKNKWTAKTRAIKKVGSRGGEERKSKGKRKGGRKEKAGCAARSAAVAGKRGKTIGGRNRLGMKGGFKKHRAEVEAQARLGTRMGRSPALAKANPANSLRDAGIPV